MSRHTATTLRTEPTKGERVADDDASEQEPNADELDGPQESEEAASKPQTSAEAEKSGGSDVPARSRIARMPALALLLALVVGVSGAIAWWSADHSDDLAAARTRDAVLVAAKQHIATLNTLDYRKVDAGLKAWQAVSTGTLKDQFASISAGDRKLLADQKKVSKGTVVDAAVLDIDGASAQVVAAVEVEVRDGKDLSKEPTVKRNRFSADLTRVGGSWKINNLQQVAVDIS